MPASSKGSSAPAAAAGGLTTTAYSPTASDTATLGAVDGDGFRTIAGTMFNGMALYDPLGGIDSIVDDGTDSTITVGSTTPGTNPDIFYNTTAIDKGAFIIVPGNPSSGSKISATVAADSGSFQRPIGVGFIRRDPVSTNSHWAFGTVAHYQSAGVNRCNVQAIVRDQWREAASIDITGDVPIETGINADGVLYGIIDATTYIDDQKQRNPFTGGTSAFVGKIAVGLSVYNTAVYRIRALSVTA